MKGIYLFIYFFNLLSSCHSDEKNIKGSKLSLEANLKGTYYYLEKDSIEDPCGKHIFFLVEVKLINKTNSEISFLTYTCSTASNVVIDTKGLITCVNTCTGNSLIINKLEPNQEFKIPVILKSKSEIQKSTRIGFILLDPNNVSDNQFMSSLRESREKLENILWSEPINLKISYEKPYEIN
jgi:hypothetical protein